MPNTTTYHLASLPSPTHPLIISFHKQTTKSEDKKAMKKRKRKEKRKKLTISELTKSIRRHYEEASSYVSTLTPVGMSMPQYSQEIYSPLLPTTPTLESEACSSESPLPPTPPTSSVVYDNRIYSTCESSTDYDYDGCVTTPMTPATCGLVSATEPISADGTPSLTTKLIASTPSSSVSVVSLDPSNESDSATSTPSTHISKDYPEDFLNNIFDSWMDCYEKKKQAFVSNLKVKQF